MISEQNFAGTAGATFSDDRLHRLVLWRRWSDARPLGFLMLNPSSAGVEDDPTIRRCVGFARREDAGGIVVCNLSPMVATDPRELYAAIAFENVPRAFPDGHDQIRTQALAPCSVVVAAWGAFAGASRIGSATLAREAARAAGCLFEARGQALRCLGTTADGWPRHPLYLPADAPLVPWEPRHG